MSDASLVRPFRDLTIHDVAIVGGKNASLGEMIRTLAPQGIRVPDGFATTSHAFRLTLKHAGLDAFIRDALKGLDIRKLKDLQARGAKIRKAVEQAPLPPELEEAIRQAYKALSRQEGGPKEGIDVAVRSSATAEDLPGASFAGQQETYLNIRGDAALLTAVRQCYASLFTDRAIAYRVDKGFDHTKVALSVGVQKMVRSDKACSGVMFTIDTESGFRDVVLINAAWGLGEMVVQGKTSPDQYYVFKPFLANRNLDPIVSRRTGLKEIKMIYNSKPKPPTKIVKNELKEQKKLCLTDEEILTLARWGSEIEKHYSKEAGEARPMDIEWAKDGVTGKLYIVQARPETVQAGRDLTVMKTYALKRRSKLLVEGLSVGSAIGKGTVRIIKDVKNAGHFKDGDVLVTTMTDPDWVPLMKKAAAIVTDSGGRTCHAAIVARELGVPAVVGTRKATKVLGEGKVVTVSCAEGESGHVYEGSLPFDVTTTELKGLTQPKTAIMLNIGQPDIAFKDSFIPNEGVGLARTEFIFTDYIKVHPLALINFSKLKDQKLKKQIEEITYPYTDKVAYFVDRLAEGIARLAAGFYPKDVIVRTSDFKTNEYAGLVGGTLFEPTESNPMIGWRGCSRYYDPAFRPAFDLECAAIKKVREEMGFENVVVMLPFCRTPKEADLVLDVMAKAGLRRGQKGLRVYVMVEIPSNIILGEEFAKRFDGFSIGSNDLTQLTLGVDRDSSIVSKVYDESNEAVKESIRKIIAIGKKNKVKVGFCGQAPSDSMEFARFLVTSGIDSISLNPDTVIKTTIDILKQEQGK
jgi:pyruvate, water dikinase